jgi:hypothetical protein
VTTSFVTYGRAASNRSGRFPQGLFVFVALPAVALVTPVGFATTCFFLGSLHIEGFILSERDGQKGISTTPMCRDLREKALVAISPGSGAAIEGPHGVYVTPDQRIAAGQNGS